MIHVCQVVSDTNVGGAGRYMLNYVRHFDRTAFRVTVLIPENSMLKPLLETYSDVTVREIPFMADRSYDKRCVKVLKSLFQQEKVDILHTHASLSARIAARQAGVKTIISTRHCIEPLGKFPVAQMKSVLNNLLCDYYVAVSEAVAVNLENSGISKKKIRKVWNGVEPILRLPDEKRSAMKARCGIEEETVFAIFARLEPIKGHTYFIEAAKSFLKQGGKGKFLIVGDGSLAESLREQAKDTPEIIFTGYVTDTVELLSITDVNVISSESEAMSLAILEAMSLGIPTIATAVGGNPQLISSGKDGILVPYQDSDEMAKAFFVLSENQKCYGSFAKSAYEKYQTCFTAEIMVKNLEALYKEAANDNK